MTNLDNLTKEELIEIIESQEDFAKHNRMVNFGKIKMLEREIDALMEELDKQISLDREQVMQEAHEKDIAFYNEVIDPELYDNHS